MWPRRGWSRALRYYSKRLLRLSGSPHSIAIGFATGVAMSMTPFIGFHYLLCVIVAFLLRGNIVAGVLGTSIGNPLTYPFIWVGTFEIGNLILKLFGGGHQDLQFEDIAHHLLTESFRTLWPIIEPMLIGALPLALVSGAIAYTAIYYALVGVQSARRERFATRRRALHGRPKPS